HQVTYDGASHWQTDGGGHSDCRNRGREYVAIAQRSAATLFAIFMLVHALLPVLPAYVCIDGGRSLSPCSPPEIHQPAQSQSEWHVGHCCKLTAAATVDAQPPKVTKPRQHDRILVALLAVSLPLMRFGEPPPCRQTQLRRRDSIWRSLSA